MLTVWPRRFRMKMPRRPSGCAQLCHSQLACSSTELSGNRGGNSLADMVAGAPPDRRCAGGGYY
jgi:hypothetical protein